MKNTRELERKADIMKDMQILLRIVLNDYTGPESDFSYLENKYAVKLEKDVDTDNLLAELDKMLGGD